MNSRIREVRKEKKLTQKELGEIMGLSRDSITSIENARTIPNELFINHFCDKFKINKNWLVNEVGSKYSTTVDEEDILAKIFASITVNDSPKLKDVILELDGLDDEYLELIENLAKGLKKVKER